MHIYVNKHAKELAFPVVASAKVLSPPPTSLHRERLYAILLNIFLKQEKSEINDF